MVALVGESGCGKTTTAQTIVRMVDHDAGSIRFQGKEIAELDNKRHAPPAARYPDHLPGSVRVAGSALPVRRTVEEPLLIHGVGESKEARAERCATRWCAPG